MRAMALMLVVVPSVACAQQVGDSIVVIRDAYLESGNTTVGRISRGVHTKVEAIDGGWLWVERLGRRGWINRRDVILSSRAVDYFTDAIHQNGSAEHYLGRALAWEQRGEYNMALADFDEAIRLDPSRADAYGNRAGVWVHKGEYERAIADYDEAIRLDPKNATTHCNRGLAWRRMGEYSKAIADYSESLRLDPKDAAARNARGLAWHLKDEHDRAIADYSEAIQLDPKNAPPYNNRGLAWFEKGEYDRAIADYDEAIRLDASYALPYNNRGLARSEKGEYDRAIADYSHAIRLYATFDVSYYNRGLAWFEKGEYDRAIADYSEAIRFNPEYASAYNSLAWLQATCPEDRYRDSRKAVENATRACELSEWKDADRIGTLAAAYAESGEFEEAINWLQKAIGVEPGNETREKMLAAFQDQRPYREQK